MSRSLVSDLIRYSSDEYIGDPINPHSSRLTENQMAEARKRVEIRKEKEQRREKALCVTALAERVLIENYAQVEDFSEVLRVCEDFIATCSAYVDKKN